MRQIRKLVIEDGYTPTEVMQQLKIPSRSFQRYYHEAFAPERETNRCGYFYLDTGDLSE
jgi:hypothetical protein